MKKSIKITLILLAHLFFVVSAAYALPTVYLLEDQLSVSSEVWFGSESEKTDSFSNAYTGPSYQGDGFHEANIEVKGRAYREVNGESVWAEDSAYSGFEYADNGDNSHFFRGVAAAGYFDNSEGWPSDEIDGRGEAAVDLYWRFRIDGDGAEMNASIAPEGNPVQTDLVLYDETEDLMLADFHETGFGCDAYFPDSGCKTGDIALLDSHIYSLRLRTWASDIGGGGDPQAAWEMYFDNSVFEEVPAPYAVLLFATGLIGLVGFTRKKRSRI